MDLQDCRCHANLVYIIALFAVHYKITIKIIISSEPDFSASLRDSTVYVTNKLKSSSLTNIFLSSSLALDSCN